MSAAGERIWGNRRYSLGNGVMCCFQATGITSELFGALFDQHTINAYKRRMVRKNREGGQFATVCKSVVPAGGDAIWNGDRSQRVTVGEGMPCDVCDTVRDGDGGQGAAVLERIGTDRCDEVAANSGWDKQFFLRADVTGNCRGPVVLQNIAEIFPCMPGRISCPHDGSKLV